MRHLISAISLTVVLQTCPIIVQAQSTEQVPVKSSEDYIQKVLQAKLMDNLPDGQFYPERLISRAELASILVKAFYLDQRQIAKQEKTIVVPDVPNYYWAYQDIQTVLKTDIMKGYRGNMFFPNQKVTRAEGLAIFAQAYGVFQFPKQTINAILQSYPDAQFIPNWARKAIATVITEGFMNTDAQGNINPLHPMTRGDMAYLLSKYLQRQKPQAETPVVPGVSQ
ncbi:S-layer homology domain-containing protein [Sphaerospermopsis aphanizomenoides BCCUSP55]|uniref:S-layer homology domain-containing protein n=1 Tax=Sphaerospermopsis aphanizomenoides TaxID=459663 RepID=UPI0019067A2F|nr:S-layer homology domain-containing protein [Sphaerospermopsis aphanizomenoides]MBK1988156.1 S-layer homology domain-containing protein [Sphaerospermopsis aphanizomenoides BCCUSP55]